MKLKKDMEFEFKADAMVVSYRGMYDFNNLEKSSLGMQLTRTSDSLTNEDKSWMEEKVADFFKEYGKASDMISLVDKHYGEEVDYLFDGRNHHVDMFEADRFNIWVRFIPQKGEHNVYIKFYKK